MHFCFVPTLIILLICPRNIWDLKFVCTAALPTISYHLPFFCLSVFHLILFLTHLASAFASFFCRLFVFLAVSLTFFLLDWLLFERVPFFFFFFSSPFVRPFVLHFLSFRSAICPILLLSQRAHLLFPFPLPLLLLFSFKLGLGT